MEDEHEIDSVMANEVADEEHGVVAAAAAAAYSMYEPHYQPMHPLIYYEEVQPVHNHHNGSHHILSSASPHDWDHESFVSQMPIISFGDPSSRAYQTASSTTGVSASSPEINTVDCINNNNRLGISEHPSYSSTNTGSSPNITSLTSVVDDCGEHQQHENGLIQQSQISTDSQRQPEQTNRELHNEIERRRRLRIKQCCDILRTLVPGLSDKTDKATVLEHTVKFVNHLVKCPNFRCDCDI